jgi:hypothetical protein
MFDCITAAGFAGELVLNDPNGPRTNFKVAEEQGAMFDRASDGCAQNLLDAGLMRPTTHPTREQLEERYAYLLDAAECLKAQGVTPPDPPSLEAYIESEGFIWIPHGAIGEQISDLDEMDAVFRACPQFSD